MKNTLKLILGSTVYSLLFFIITMITDPEVPYSRNLFQSIFGGILFFIFMYYFTKKKQSKLIKPKNK